MRKAYCGFAAAARWPGLSQEGYVDTGKGIGPEFLPHVFEPFRQAENVTTRVHVDMDRP